VPTWELKQQSHRGTAVPYHDIAYGRIPPAYLLQIVAPWHFYANEYNINRDAPPNAPETNKVEAHLYFGLVPLALIVFGLAGGGVLRNRLLWPWVLLGSIALVVTTGCLTPVFRQLPGFSYFGGPGRYGILTTMAGALLAGAGLQTLLARQNQTGRALLTSIVIVGTVYDLYLVYVYEQVNPAAIIDEAIINRRFTSDIRDALKKSPQPARVLAPGPNLLTCLGVAATPNFLGLAPVAYFDPELKMPGEFSFNAPAAVPAADQLEWLRRAGVTHILTYAPLRTDTWPVREIVYNAPRVDLFVHLAFNRLPSDPIYLYELRGSRGRVAWEEPQTDATASVAEYAADRVVIEADSKNGGRLILTDLAYPDWKVTVDGNAVPAVVVERMYRGVDLGAGKHTVVWSYRPTSAAVGCRVTAVAFVTLAICAAMLWRRRKLKPATSGP
jgi:hypothetical protein